MDEQLEQLKRKAEMMEKDYGFSKDMLLTEPVP